MQRGRWTTTPVYTGNAIARSRTHCLVVLFIIMHITAIARGLLCVYGSKKSSFSLFLFHTQTHTDARFRIFPRVSINVCIVHSPNDVTDSRECSKRFRAHFQWIYEKIFPRRHSKGRRSLRYCPWMNECAWERRNGKEIKSKSEILFKSRCIFFFLKRNASWFVDWDWELVAA